MQNEHTSKGVSELKSMPASSSVPRTPQNMENPTAEDISRELTELMTKAAQAKEQTGTMTQIISGGFLGISILFIITMAQMKLSLSLNISLVLFSLCIPIFALEFLLNSFKIENFRGNTKPFDNLVYLFPLGYVFAFFGIFLFLFHVIHIAALLFVLSPILIPAYLFSVARIQKWMHKWKWPSKIRKWIGEWVEKQAPAPGAAAPSSVETPVSSSEKSI